MVHNTLTIGTSAWYMENAYSRVKKPDQFKVYRPNKVLSQIARDQESPPDYFIIWEGGVNDFNCTRDLASVKIPKVMWFSDSYPVKGYQDYFPFEVAWAKATKPDIILMAQKSMVEEMNKKTDVPTYWFPFAGDMKYHYNTKEIEPNYDFSFVGTINPNKDHADQKKAYYLSKLAENGMKVRATISHNEGEMNKEYKFEWKIARPVLDFYSQQVCMGKIGFNCCIAGDLTSRTFEIPLMERPLLSNGGDNWNHIFKDGESIVIYNENNIIEKAKSLQDESFRNKIAKNGYDIIIKNHTWQRRIEQIEDLINNKVGKVEREILWN